MKRPGLTPAMRRALTNLRGGLPVGLRTSGRALESGFIHREGTSYRLTPRGHAALAAEPMTDEQYTALALIEGHGDAVVTHLAVYKALWLCGWVSKHFITPAGRAQLHNIRAAMPGEWAP